MPHIFLNTSNFNGDNRFYTNSAIKISYIIYNKNSIP